MAGSGANSAGPLLGVVAGGGSAAGLSSIEQNMILEKLKELQQLLLKCEDERSRNEQNMQNIAKTNERMQIEPQKLYYKQKLKTLYKSALEDADVEADMFYRARELIFDIRSIFKRPRKPGLTQRSHGYSSSAHGMHQPKETSMRRGALMKLLHQAAQTLPLFIPLSPNERLPPLCGSIPAEPNHTGKPGDLVAALVKSEEGDENWILAEIVYYNSQTNKYEIDDIDEEQKERHILSRRRIVPLPTFRANPETHPQALFPRKSLVLALYPQTTCFYRAIIQEQPKLSTDQYKVLFEDSSYPEGYSPSLGVPQRYVIMSKEMRRK